MSNNTTVKNTRGHPREFEAIITEKSRNFVGREFVFSAINNFLQEYDRGYFTIIGEPGIGKSAILAKYVKENSGVVYYNVDPPQPPLKRGEFKDETFLQRREFQDETNFMYVKEMLASQNLPNNTLPQKLQDYYQEHYEKMKSAVEKNQSISLDVLNLLIQDKQPISVEAIAERLEEDEYDIEIILDQWREFLHLETIENQVYYHFYHHNFCDWLRQKLNLKTT